MTYSIRTPAVPFVAVLIALFSIDGGSWTPARAEPFQVAFPSPSIDRWMYPHNATPGTRPTAPVFGTLGDESGVDSRHGQFLVGFDTATAIPPGLGASRYLVRRARLFVTVSRDQSFALDETPDPITSYLPAEHPAFTADPDPGRPVELFGVGFRNGFTEESFTENAPFGGAEMGERNAFAVGYDTAGHRVDVGNNVGKTNVAFPTFEAPPFAVGHCTNVAPGERVPAGTTVEFDLNLEDPFVAQYVQEACHSGRLRLMLTSLQTSGFGGAPAWAEFHTRDSVLGDPPRLELVGTAIGPDDTDGDGLPDDWERHYFGSLTGDKDADSDADGAPERAEFEAGTDPGTREEVLTVEISHDVAEARIRVRFRHAPSRQYALESSTDLKQWLPVPTAETTYEPGTGRAAIAAEYRPDIRFYRLAAQSADFP